MKISPLDFAYICQDAYSDKTHRQNQLPVINDRLYKVFDVANRPSGYHAIAYQQTVAPYGVVIAERGTVFKPLWHPVVTDKDLKVDKEMVKDATNAQWPDAQSFAERVLAEVKRQETLSGQSIQVTVTGHSLGGTLAEITAYKYGLHGVTFNSYGAADLGYGVPRGGDDVIDYVVGSDVVSAASHHFGRVVGYARQQDLQNMERGRYLDPPDPAHPTDPLLTGSLSAHSLDNFAPMKPGEAPSILTAANHARYLRHQAQFERFRGEVLARSDDLHEVLNHDPDPAYGARLEAAASDAMDVAAYDAVVRGAEYEAGIPVVESVLDADACGLRQAAMHVDVAVDVGAHLAFPLNGTAAQTVAAAGPSLKAMLDTTASEVHAASQSIERTAQRLAGTHAHDAVVDAWTSAERIAGRGLHRTERAVETGIDDAERVAASTREAIGEGLARAGHALAAAADAAGRDAAKGMTAFGDTMRYAYNDMRHPEHALFQSAREAVRVMETGRGIAPGQHSERLAAALAVAARRDGLHRVDIVALTKDGSKAWAVEGDPHAPLPRRTHVDTAQAVQTPVEQSHAAMASARQHAAQQARMQQLQTQRQTQQQATQQQTGPVLSR